MIRAAARLQALSAPAALRFGVRLGNLGYLVAGRQRRRALANLNLAYGEEMTPAQRTALTRRIFQHFGRATIDFLRAPARSVADLARLVSCEGWEHVETALARGKGVVLVTGHLGNWELLGRWLATVQKVPLTVVAREPDHPALAAYLRSMRENAGFTVLSKGGAARGLLRALKRGEAILILNDQNSADVFVPFFGIPTGTAVGPASLALHSGAALIPLYCVEKPDHSFHVNCLPPLAADSAIAGETISATENQPADILQVTAALNRVLEDVVRQYPEQWLWLHNRWKSAFDETQRHLRWTDETEFYAARERWKTGKR
jgi:KDO2-lipid IV(A) lauroyltransferase